MASLRKLKAYVLGQSDIHASAEELQEAAIPVSTGDCRYCPDPCDEGHEEYPARFNVDFETQMLGSVKPYRRQVIIGTGKSDWPSHINLDFHSLASYLESAVDSAPKSLPPSEPSNDAKKVPGVFDSSTVTKISILNGSHHTVADDPDHDTVLILPDYKVVTNIERSKKGAQELFAAAVDPALGRAGRVVEGSNVRSWVLPYSCVILLCSHKRRDNRCGIAAPKLEQGFTHSLRSAGWEVHTSLEHDQLLEAGEPLEEFKGTEEEKEKEIVRRLKELDPRDNEAGGKTRRALVVKNSHMGGHKFAGNCIIYTPQGISIWYGRVTPHQVDAIVKETILGGKVLPSLLRGGLNLCRPGYESLHDW